MSNRFDDENNIEMDIKTAFASWGKYVFKCFPQDGRLRSFLSEDSLEDSEEENVDIINNPFIDSMVDRDNLLKAVERIAEGEKFATVVYCMPKKEQIPTGYHSSRFALMMMAEQLRQ